MTDLRCANKKHGELVSGCLEIKCSSRFCGASAGVVVIHRYDVDSGDLVETRKFRDPRRNKEVRNGVVGHGIAVRTA